MPKGYTNGAPISKRRLPIPDNLRLDWDDPTPIDEAKTTRVKRRWVCRAGSNGNAPCGNVWYAELINRLSMGSGCTRCMYAKQRAPISEEVRAAWADDRPIDSVLHGDKTAKWRCKSCAKTYKASISNRLLASGLNCTRCKTKAVRVHLRKRQPTAAMLLEWGEDFPMEQAFFRRTLYRWFHRSGENPCGKPWFTRIDNRFAGDGCPHCSRGQNLKLPKTTGMQRRMAKCQEAIQQIAILESMEQAAIVVGVTSHTLYAWRKRGYLPKTIGGCKRRYERMLSEQPATKENS